VQNRTRSASIELTETELALATAVDGPQPMVLLSASCCWQRFLSF
jgi:hypothetical protein